jgi:hypothetical protein
VSSFILIAFQLTFFFSFNYLHHHGKRSIAQNPWKVQFPLSECCFMTQIFRTCLFNYIISLTPHLINARCWLNQNHFGRFWKLLENKGRSNPLSRDMTNFNLISITQKLWNKLCHPGVEPGVVVVSIKYSQMSNNFVYPWATNSFSSVVCKDFH